MKNRFERIWAMRPEAVLTIVRLVSRESAGASIGSASGKAELIGTSWTAAAPFLKVGSGGSRVGVIPIQGILTNDGPANFGSNYQTIANAAEKQAADPDVSRIVLQVDSPGGEVTGLPETAAVLARVARIKPVSAIVDGAAASAAFWLASQASDITVTPSGEVGSVGVRMMHVDMSKMLESEGYKVTEMHSGAYKTEWSPYQTLSDAAKVDMQKRLDISHAEFLGAIKAGRGARLAPATIKSRMGEGRMFSAPDALAAGLVDKVQPTRDFFQTLTQPRTGAIAPGGARADSPTRRIRARLELEKARV